MLNRAALNMLLVSLRRRVAVGVVGGECEGGPVGSVYRHATGHVQQYWGGYSGGVGTRMDGDRMVWH